MGITPCSNHTSDFKGGTQGVAMSDAWLYGVSAGTGWSVVRVL